MGLSIIVYGRLPSGGRHSRERRNPATQCSRTLSEKTETPPPSFPQKRESSNRKTTGIYQKKQKPHRVIPAQAGIQKHNAAGLYRKKPKPPPTVIPAKAGIQKRNATGLYRKKPKPHRPSFPQKLESKNATQQEFIGKNRNPTAVIPAKAGIQTRRHGNLPNKTVSLDSTS
ncbi:putative phage associated protein [Neisseria meningitidis 93003]|nr:putative phage associated protein [Neisseria meningitidis 93003]